MDLACHRGIGNSLGIFVTSDVEPTLLQHLCGSDIIPRIDDKCRNARTREEGERFIMVKTRKSRRAEKRGKSKKGEPPEVDMFN